MSPDGSLNNKKAAWAILQHQNMSLPGIRLSPAQILLHNQPCDSIPSHPSHYKLLKVWILIEEQREKGLSKCNHLLVERCESKVQELLPLAVHTNVVLQHLDQKWNCTAHIVEVMPNQQYHIRIFHSEQVTLCNHQFICYYIPITSGTWLPLPSASTPSETFETLHPDNPDSEQNFKRVHENP